MLFMRYGQIAGLQIILKEEFGWSNTKIENYFQTSVSIDGSEYALSEKDQNKRSYDLWELLNTKYSIFVNTYYDEDINVINADTDVYILVPHDKNAKTRYISR